MGQKKLKLERLEGSQKSEVYRKRVKTLSKKPLEMSILTGIDFLLIHTDLKKADKKNIHVSISDSSKLPLFINLLHVIENEKKLKSKEVLVENMKKLEMNPDFYINPLPDLNPNSRRSARSKVSISNKSQGFKPQSLLEADHFLDKIEQDSRGPFNSEKITRSKVNSFNHSMAFFPKMENWSPGNPSSFNNS